MIPEYLLTRFPWLPAVVLLVVALVLVVVLGFRSPLLPSLILAAAVIIFLLVGFDWRPRRKQQDPLDLWPPLLHPSKPNTGWILPLLRRLTRRHLQGTAQNPEPRMQPRPDLLEPAEKPVQAVLPFFDAQAGEPKHPYHWDETKGIE